MTTSARQLRIVVVSAALVAMCTLPRDVRAQGISGTVRDALTSDALPGVLISVLDVDGERVRGVLSDAAGRFVVEVPMGRYQLRAERIGLRTETTEPFDLNTLRMRFELIEMAPRAVRIDGLVVDSRVRSCRIDPEAAVRIQRWWLEIKTALDASSILQREQFAHFQVEKFEREWGADLRRIVTENRRVEVSLSSRPFASAGAEFLADGGFVQGDIFYAPDADVLLSDIFLSQHCFSLVVDDERDHQLGLRFEPTRARAVTDITGTLWVDTTTAELQNLDFRYANLDGAIENESGGLVAFEYLPSGAWIVSEWYIRMPKVGLRREGGRQEFFLLGYIDVGGEVAPLPDLATDVMGGAMGAIRGVVFDSIRGGGLAGATVTVLGTGIQATTDVVGEFILINVPVGRHKVTFFHTDTDAWGLGSSFVEVDVKELLTSDARMAIPGFRQAARSLCLGRGADAQTVIVGHMLGREREGLANVPIELSWQRQFDVDSTLAQTILARTGPDGRFVVCTVPGEMRLKVRAEVNGRWIDAFEVVVPVHQITYREVWFTR